MTSLPQEALSNEWGQLSPDAALTLNAPGMDPLHVPLKQSSIPDSELKQCTCWEWSGLARDEGMTPSFLRVGRDPLQASQNCCQSLMSQRSLLGKNFVGLGSFFAC